MLFYSFFKSLVGKDVVVELKNDLSICGTLHSVDQYLNIKVVVNGEMRKYNAIIYIFIFSWLTFRLLTQTSILTFCLSKPVLSVVLWSVTFNYLLTRSTHNFYKTLQGKRSPRQRAKLWKFWIDCELSSEQSCRLCLLILRMAGKWTRLSWARKIR